MPANLNALIRYKTIDQCLRNPHRKHDIQSLKEACSEALAEYRGVYKGVGERTIRDDIRVMRSDILGFNAPIVYNDKHYSYSDPDYSIFNTSIREKKLLDKIYKLLLEEWQNIEHPDFLEVLKKLAKITRNALPSSITMEIKKAEISALEEELEMTIEQSEKEEYLREEISEEELKIEEKEAPSETLPTRGISHAKMGPTFIDIETQTDFYLKRRGFLGLFRKQVEVLLKPYSWESILKLFESKELK